MIQPGHSPPAAFASSSGKKGASSASVMVPGICTLSKCSVIITSSTNLVIILPISYLESFQDRFRSRSLSNALAFPLTHAPFSALSEDHRVPGASSPATLGAPEGPSWGFTFSPVPSPSSQKCPLRESKVSKRGLAEPSLSLSGPGAQASPLQTLLLHNNGTEALKGQGGLCELVTICA